MALLFTLVLAGGLGLVNGSNPGVVDAQEYKRKIEVKIS